MADDYVKVLVNGRSCHGGDLDYSLPTQSEDGEWTPGDWHEVDGEIRVCTNGLHITNDPAAWWHPGAEAYGVEYEGDTDARGDDKIAVRRLRLTRKLTPAELAAHRIFTEGIHDADGAGHCVADGSAQMEAYNRVQVRAFSNAQVEAYDSVHVEAHDSAHVEAHDSAHVEAHDSVHVKAFSNAQVEAFDSVHVEAFDSAQVHTTGARDAPTVAVSGHAVWVDHRSGKPIIHAITGAEVVLHDEPGDA